MFFRKTVMLIQFWVLVPYICRTSATGASTSAEIGGHSITTWTRRRGEGVSQMSTIVHAREGGGLGNVHVDNIFGKMCFFAPK